MTNTTHPTRAVLRVAARMLVLAGVAVFATGCICINCPETADEAGLPSRVHFDDGAETTSPPMGVRN